jgi:PAS domain S-box-containing protein
MPSKDSLAKTMRIDILPELPQADEKQGGHGTWTMSGAKPTSILHRVDPKGVRSEDYKKLLESVYDAVLLAEGAGRVVDFNSRAGDFFRCREDQLYSTNVIQLISGADENLLAAIHRNLEEHRYTLIECKCVRRDGTFFPAEVAVNRVNLDSESQLCFFVRDITVRKRAQDALREAVARLEEHDRARSQFISNVSHEVRTPLTSMIYAIANILKGVTGPVPDEVRRYLEMLDGDCRRMLNTVNDILDLRNIENHSLTLTRTTLPVSRLLRVGMESLRVQAERRSIAMKADVSYGRWFVHCDANKMERVLINIIGNAVKFTPDGGAVDALVSDDPDRDGFVRLAIRDTGIGIPPEAIDKVTLRYFTVGEQPSGSGLGLAISREIVELHGGHLEIHSPPQGHATGTVVYVSLPVVPPPTVLVVDGDDNVLNVLSGQLGARGYRVILANGVGNAVEQIVRERPGLLVMSIRLWDQDGTDLILKMKSDKALMRIPIIAMVDSDISRGKSEILQGLSIPVLSKPWEVSELMDRVERALLAVSASTRAE